MFQVISTALISNLLIFPAMIQGMDLQNLLQNSGENRIVLESCLHAMKAKDTEYLIQQLSQYDLVNITKEQLIENITYARKVRGDLPYLGGKVSDELWRKWVLPHRVLDEDLSLWRKDFYEQMQPIILGKTTTAEVAEAIHDWLLVSGEKKPQMVFGNGGETRQRTPAQLLKAGVGACGELCMVYVYLLRAVGIPARHCSLGYYTSRDNGHLFVEYWDAQLKSWTAVDASVERRLDFCTPRQRVAAGEWSALAMVAHPGFARNRDCYGTAFWNECISITGNLVTPNRIEVCGPEMEGGVVSANVWNCGVWRTTARSGPPSEGSGNELFVANIKPTDRPVLWTSVKNGELHWAVERPKMNAIPITLVKAESGKCLQWSER